MRAQGVWLLVGFLAAGCGSADGGGSPPDGPPVDAAAPDAPPMAADCGAPSATPLALAGGSPSTLAVDDRAVYFIEDGELRSVSRCGGPTTDLGPTAVQGFVDLGTDGAHVYFTTGFATSGATIFAIPVGGGPPSSLILYPPLRATQRLLVDGSTLYFADVAIEAFGMHRTIRAMPTSGWAVTVLNADVPLGTPGAAALTDSHLYITGQVPIGSGIYEVPLDGGPRSPLAEVPGVVLSLVATDSDVYYLSAEAPDQATVGRVPATGGASTLLGSGLAGARALALDAQAAYVLVTDGVVEMPLGGGAARSLVVGQVDPSNLLVDARSVYWSSATIGGIGRAPTNPPTFPATPVQAVATGVVSALAHDASGFYFVDDQGNLFSAPPGGGPASPLANWPPGSVARALVTDASNVYWALDSRIFSTPKAGGGSATLLAEAVPIVMRVAANEITWVDPSDAIATGYAARMATSGWGVTNLATAPDPAPIPILASDGQSLVYSMGHDIVLVPKAGGAPRPLASFGLTSSLVGLAADGAFVYAALTAGDTGGRLVQVAQSDGTQTPLAVLAPNFPTGLAQDDLRIYYVNGRQILALPKAGGAPAPLVSVEQGAIDLFVHGGSLFYVDLTAAGWQITRLDL